MREVFEMSARQRKLTAEQVRELIDEESDGDSNIEIGNLKRNNMSENRCSVYVPVRIRTLPTLIADLCDPWLCCKY